jgi:hypothetical protein
MIRGKNEKNKELKMKHRRHLGHHYKTKPMNRGHRRRKGGASYGDSKKFLKS